MDAARADARGIVLPFEVGGGCHVQVSRFDSPIGSIGQEFLS